MKLTLIRLFIACIYLGAMGYGAVRLFFWATDGFLPSNILSEHAYDPRWETRGPTAEELTHLDRAVAQPFTYLGKGCQSYVFGSADGAYVVKFFKYQRFRPSIFLRAFRWIPAVERVYRKNAQKKREILDYYYSSWLIAYNELPEQTGIFYLHLNKGGGIGRELVIVDKLGLSHRVKLDQVEFLLQKRAVMLDQTLEQMVAEGRLSEAKSLLTTIVNTLVAEHKRGLIDRDHALLQNTGVIEGRPIHIDVGQFVADARLQEPNKGHQELYNKTYRLRLYLQQLSGELLFHLDGLLREEMGDLYFQLKYIPKPHHMVQFCDPDEAA